MTYGPAVTNEPMAISDRYLLCIIRDVNFINKTVTLT